MLKGRIKLKGFKGIKSYLACFMTLGLLITQFVLPTVIAAETIVFKTQEGGIYDGMPLFDGDPDHLDAYVDTFFEYAGVEGAAVYATESRNANTGYYLLTKGKNSGKKIPSGHRAHDHVQGVSTDFPTMTSLGQTWNKDLISRVGTVIGNEQLNTVSLGNSDQDFKDYNPVFYTAVSDIRINPLSGRIEESFSEDPILTAELVKALGGGANGTALPESDNGFWLKAIVGTKHFPNYAAQWFRTTGNKDTSARSLMEYHTRTVLKSVSAGAVNGVMSSYGRTNGVPNILSPYFNYVRDYAPYAFYTSPDANAYTHLSNNAYGNGYDTKYSPDQTAAKALMMIANSAGGGSSFGNDTASPVAVYNAVEQGLYGLTAQDVFDTARDPFVNMVRTGLFNERDENGLPKNYPWINISKGQGLTLDNTYDPHKTVALEAAQESIVLLKNKDNILPIAKDSSLSVVGTFADARFKSTYSVGATPTYDNAAFSPLTGIRTLSDDSDSLVKYATGAKVIAIKTADGKYLVADTATNGNVLTAQAVNPFNTPAAQFELYEWGQDGFSLLSLANNKWINYASNSVKNNGTQALNTTENPWDNGLNVGQSNMPSVFRWDYNEDGTVSLIANSYGGGFGGGFERAYWTGGRHLYMNNGEFSVFSTALTNEATRNSQRTAAAKFTISTVKETAEVVYNDSNFSRNDYAVVVVGAPPRHSAGEGSDRSDLAMGNDQYEMVEAVANKYPGRTIVILKTNFPVLMEKIQNNDKVAAIIHQQYAGQYDGFAMGQAIFGDYAPTGRLTSTWYASMDAIPDMDREAISEGDNNTISMENLDPRFTKDYVQSGPIETGLTYMFTESDVTYPFGYGLSYSTFEYGELKKGAVNADGTFTMTVDVKNTGSVNTSEIIQLYTANTDSVYGDSAPQKQLVTFEKVYIAAGETKTATLTVDPFDFAIWDVNSNDYLVERGSYNFFVGSSCEAPLKSTTVDIEGGVPSNLYAAKAPVNVFDHSFISENVTYRELSKETTINQLSAHSTAEYYAVMSKDAGAWAALSNVYMSDTTGIKLRVASTDSNPGIEIRLDAPDGDVVATFDFNATSSVTKQLGGGMQTTELAYRDIQVDVAGGISGVHDLYIVFTAPDVRVDSLQLIKALTNTSLLETLIGKAEKIKDDGLLVGIIPAIVNEFEAALKEAKALVNGEPTKQEISASQIRLLTAIQSISDEYAIANKDDLKAAIELAEFVEENIDKYVDNGKDEFAAALSNARDVVVDENALKDEVNETYMTLVDAMVNLKLKADKEALNQLINKAKKIDLSLYTTESVTLFETALLGASAVASDDTLSIDNQGKVDTTLQKLEDAIDSLVLLSTDGEKGSSGTPEKTGQTAPLFYIILLVIAGLATVITSQKVKKA